jgi:hypothetical protein
VHPSECAALAEAIEGGAVVISTIEGFCVEPLPAINGSDMSLVDSDGRSRVADPPRGGGGLSTGAIIGIAIAAVAVPVAIITVIVVCKKRGPAEQSRALLPRE